MMKEQAESKSIDDEESKEPEKNELMQSFLQSLAQPEELLMPLFWPDHNNDSSLLNERQHQLRLVCQELFGQVERLANAYSASLKSEDAPTASLSGLDELYIGKDSQSPVDAETLWGQAELQNEALRTLLKSSIKKVIKAVEGEKEEVRLLDMNDILSGDEDDDDETGSGSEESNEDNDGDEEEEESGDEETKRMRARMERATDDMEDSDMDANEAELEDDDRDNLEASEEEESLEDPAADELNDGFFSVQEMEEFADEEEAYLPEEAYGTVQPPENDLNDGEPKKSFHQRQREDDVDSVGEDDEDESDDDLAFRAPEVSTIKRQKYRTEQEIEALYSLYKKTSEDGGDDDDSVVNMTAVDFFGKPNKKYFDKWNAKSQSEKKMRIDDNIADEVDSWDEHGFEDDGPGWRDEDPKEKRVTFGEDEVKEYEKDDVDVDDEDKKVEDTTEREAISTSSSSSSHAKQSEKLRRKTEQLEKELLAEKPWQMLGESKATARPVNSLLEASPEFEVATKMAPLITVEHTANLEDVIKQRILDEDWDDVVPRELPDVAWNKKRGELPEVSQEKSKLGLGELYEREYLKKAVGYDVDAAEKETEEEKAKSEMKALFANLCSKLDSLCNYHFAPRPIADEAEVRAVTKPAIAMEEVLPLHVSDARGVAPEEVYGTKKGRDGILRGDSELDQVERKRLRSAKKSARRKARKEKLADEKLLSRLQPGLGLNNPYEKRKVRAELAMARSKGKIVQGQRDSNADYGASGKFFKRMQEQVEQSVHHGDGEEPLTKKQKRGQDGQKSSIYKL